MATESLTLAGTRLIDDAGDLGPPVDVVVADSRIVAVRPGGSAGKDAVDLAGTVCVPGLVNGHTHSHEILQRGRYPKLPLEVWMHYLRPPRPAYRLDPEQLYVRTALAAIEALRGGATTVVDDVNLLPDLDETSVAAVARAYRDVGLRAFVGPSLFDLPYFSAVPFLEEEMPPELLAELSGQPRPEGDALLALAGRLIDAYPRGERVSVIAAPSAPQRCSDAFLTALLGLARERGAPSIVHVNETRLQAVTAQRRYGRTMVGQLEALGLLQPRLSLIHGVWLTPHDIELLARAGASVQHNPVSNLRLGSGVAPVRELLDGGVNVTLGTDGCGSCVAASALDNVRQGALLGSLRGDLATWLTVREVWAMGTTAAAAPLGLAGQLGAVAPGQLADLVAYRLDELAFTPLNDPLRQLVYGHARPSTTVVDGVLVLHEGRFVAFDETDLLERARALHSGLRDDLARSDAFVDSIRPVYERVHRRALGERIPPDTYRARL